MLLSKLTKHTIQLPYKITFNIIRTCITSPSIERPPLRTVVIPTPFDRYEHLYVRKMDANKSRIHHLPLPTPNASKVSLIDCIMITLIHNGPQNIHELWSNIKPMGVIHSKRRLLKRINTWKDKYGKRLPFVNLKELAIQNEKEKYAKTAYAIDDDELNDNSKYSDSDNDSDNDIKSESDIDPSDISDGFKSDSITTSFSGSDVEDLEHMPSIFGIKESSKDKLIEKYSKRWQNIENKHLLSEYDINGKLNILHNTSLWYYCIHEKRKGQETRPRAKGPLTLNELKQRVKDDKIKSLLIENRITMDTPVFNFIHVNQWETLHDVLRIFDNE